MIRFDELFNSVQFTSKIFVARFVGYYDKEILFEGEPYELGIDEDGYFTEPYWYTWKVSSMFSSCGLLCILVEED